MHIKSHPSILYFGTPVVLISTKNENETDNLAPIVIRILVRLAMHDRFGPLLQKQTQNLMRTKQCVLNLPSVNQAHNVNLLAKTTGSNPVPEGKQQKGYRYEQDQI